MAGVDNHISSAPPISHNYLPPDTHSEKTFPSLGAPHLTTPIAEATTSRAPSLSARSVAQRPAISFRDLKRFDQKQIEKIYQSRTESEAKKTVSLLQRAFESLYSFFKNDYITKADAAAAFFSAVDGKSPTESYQAVRELLKPEERNRIKLELVQSDNGDWSCKLLMENIAISLENQQPLSGEEVSAAKKLIDDLAQQEALISLQRQNPEVNVSEFYSEIAQLIENSQSDKKQQEINEVDLLKDINRYNFRVKDFDFPRKGNDIDSFKSKLTDVTKCSDKQMLSIMALAHQGTTGILYTNLANTDDMNELYLNGKGNTSFSIKEDAENIYLYSTFETQWQDHPTQSARPETMKEPFISFAFKITPEGNTYLMDLNFCKRRGET